MKNGQFEGSPLYYCDCVVKLQLIYQTVAMFEYFIEALYSQAALRPLADSEGEWAVEEEPEAVPVITFKSRQRKNWPSND